MSSILPRVVFGDADPYVQGARTIMGGYVWDRFVVFAPPPVLVAVTDQLPWRHDQFVLQPRYRPRLYPLTETDPERSSLLLAPGGSRRFLWSFRWGFPLSYHVPPQMVDKIWHDLKNRDIRNKLAYRGGSVQATSTFARFIRFQNGLGPYVGVSVLNDVKCKQYLMRPLLVQDTGSSDGLRNATVWDVMGTKAGVLCRAYAQDGYGLS